uniref:Uncharacterized protein n=1 Tax=Schistocephalus solidus TaxID=70667 RepID=A0A0V0JAL1_SCHSO
MACGGCRTRAVSVASRRFSTSFQTTALSDLKSRGKEMIFFCGYFFPPSQYHFTTPIMVGTGIWFFKLINKTGPLPATKHCRYTFCTQFCSIPRVIYLFSLLESLPSGLVGGIQNFFMSTNLHRIRTE